jgi:hypothetical protein
MAIAKPIPRLPPDIRIVRPFKLFPFAELIASLLW